MKINSVRTVLRHSASRWQVAAIVGAIIVCSLSARANEANYQQYVIGDRAAGMGGAASALGTALDASYYNPAGLAYTKQSTISISASLYGWQRYRSERALYPDEDLQTSSFITVPPAMGLVFFAAPETAVGLAAFVPYRNSMSEIIAFTKDKNFYNASLDDQTIMVGPSAAHAFSKEFSVGLGVYGVYRNLSSFQSVYLNNYSYSASQSLKYKTFGMLGNAGLQYRPTDNWRFGAAVQSPSFGIWGNGEYEGNRSVDDSGQMVNEFEHADNMNAEYRIPAKFTVGAGWEKEKVCGFGLDVTWHLANSYNRLSGHSDLSEGGEPLTSEYVNQGVVDVNLGGEYYIAEAYPIRAGFFTTRSSAPDVDLNKPDYPAQINEYGVTFSVGRELQNILMSVGVNYIFGSGDNFGYTIDPDTQEVVRAITAAKESQLYLFFNTSYMF
ncbi:MAG: outer membrane protein transport protein [Kiritimatiellia bacterium]|nr:outer membrane protein transport protein [Kiritimatiellia bacterium]